MNKRANPFANLAEAPAFTTKPRSEKPVEEEMVARLAEENNFQSRQPAKSPTATRRKPRIYRTGRNQPLSVKVTAETLQKIYKAADERKVTLGEVLRLAMDALEREGASRKEPKTLAAKSGAAGLDHDKAS